MVEVGVVSPLGTGVAIEVIMMAIGWLLLRWLLHLARSGVGRGLARTDGGGRRRGLVPFHSHSDVVAGPFHLRGEEGRGRQTKKRVNLT